MISLKPLKMKEAAKFWADKVILKPGQFNKLSDEAKLRAFAVGGIAKQDELETVFNSLQKAVEQGNSFGEFKKECRTIFAKRGWTGKAAWRIDNIFRTNVQTAFNVGRYKQMKAVVKSRPYWKYSAINDSRTRPTHAALNGKVFPADSNFWDTWYPPNGFRCRCSVISLSERQVEKQGLTIETKDPTGGLIEPVDPRTGNKMPARYLMPDPGFSYNPGKSVYGGLTPREGETGFTDIGVRNYDNYGRRKMANLPARAYRAFTKDSLLPGGEKSACYIDEFLKVFGLQKKREGIFVDKVNDPLIISENLFRSDAGSLKVKKRGRERFMKLLAETIKDPYEIWLTPMKEKRTGRVVLRKRFIRGFSTGPEDKLEGFAAFEYGADGWKGVTAFKPDELKHVDNLRNGVLLYKE